MDVVRVLDNRAHSDVDVRIPFSGDGARGSGGRAWRGIFADCHVGHASSVRRNGYEKFLLGIDSASSGSLVDHFGRGFQFIRQLCVDIRQLGISRAGIQGAAIASVVAHSISLFAMVLYSLLVAEIRRYRLFNNIWRRDLQALSEIFNLGWPISATLLAETGLFGISAVMMGWIDVESLAAHGIAIEIASIVFMVYLGFANAGTAQLGRAMGKKDRIALTAASQSVVVITLIAAGLTVAMMVAIPQTLVVAFLDQNIELDSKVVVVGVTLVQLAALFQLADAMQVVAIGLLRGLSDTRTPMIIATFSYLIVGIPTGYVLGFVVGFGGVGIWLGFIVGLGLAAVLLFMRFRKLLNRVDI